MATCVLSDPRTTCTLLPEVGGSKVTVRLEGLTKGVLFEKPVDKCFVNFLSENKCHVHFIYFIVE